MNIEEIEARVNWRFRWLSLIFEFSHLEYQKGLWLDNKYPNEIGCFGEDICKYFEDLYLDDNYEYQLEKGFISHQEYSIIEKFHFELYRFAEMTNKPDKIFIENDILENREWIKLCRIGQIAWSKLKQIVSDQKEKDHMVGLEDNYLKEKVDNIS